jgi:signal transduction histidine kinase
MNELFEPEAAARYTARIAAAATSPTSREYEDRTLLDGRPEWYLSIYTRVLDPSGNVVGVQILSHDITERKRMEGELHDTNRKLNLLSNITMHDISNQLQAMTGLLELAQIQEDRTRAAKYIDKALVSGDRIGAMIRFTRDYESIGVLAPSWLNIRMVIERAWATAQHGEYQMHDDVDATLEFYADNLVGKVFHNLMDNSMNHGGKVSTIRCRTEMGEEGLKVIVEDDGIGIMHHDKERIFERGYGKDHGLGLFLSREILGITGIHIRETGQPFQGARFEITVPKSAYRRIE